jgi:putative sigma-54 modulation protein
MRLDITGRHVTVTPAIRQLITRRLAPLERVLNDAAISALVILTKEKYRHKVEIAIHTRGDHTLSGTAEANTWPLAMRAGALKLEQQAKKLKGKWGARKREAAQASRNRRALPQPDETRIAAGSDGPRVVRATRYAIKPMSVEDAALRLETLDDAFLVFRNADDGDAVMILYRRKDGNLGLIQP